MREFYFKFTPDYRISSRYTLCHYLNLHFAAPGCYYYRIIRDSIDIHKMSETSKSTENTGFAVKDAPKQAFDKLRPGFEGATQVICCL